MKKLITKDQQTAVCVNAKGNRLFVSCTTVQELNGKRCALCYARFLIVQQCTSLA